MNGHTPSVPPSFLPRIGIGIMIFKNDKILMGKRKGSHGAGEYSFCGGHLEYMEGFEECAHREAKEECGIEIQNIRFQGLANITRYAPKHYINIGLVADWKSGTPAVLEPNKCEGWEWCSLNKLPHPISEMALVIINSYKENQPYMDKF